jgi:hypothetical protein
MFLTIPFNMFYYIALKYGNFLLEILDTFPLLKDAYTQSRKLYENLKKGGIVEKRGEEETKSMPQVPVDPQAVLDADWQTWGHRNL